MADDTNDIRELYNESAEKESTRLDRHRLERDMTWRYLDKYLPRRGKILEVGCAAGAYTIPLAKRGYDVTAVDFSRKLLDICRRKVKNEHLERKVECVLADARDLSGVLENVYDVALVMGPLYHLILEEDRRAVLKQVRLHLKKGGLIFSAFISRYGIWTDVMKNFAGEVEWPGWFQAVIENGKQDIPPEQKGKAFRAYFAAPGEIAPLHESAGFKTMALAGIETCGIQDETFNELKGKRRELWLDLLFSISTEPSIIGASNHILYVGEKAG